MANGSEGSTGVGYGTRLRHNLRALSALVEELEPDRFHGNDARQLTELFAWGERLCATGKGLAAKRVADTGVWVSSGQRTAADWLARVSGQTPGQAGAALETARRMRDQPDVEAAARSGHLSEQQSAAVTAAASAAPSRTPELLQKAADDSLAALQEQSKKIKLLGDGKAESDRYRAIHAGRYFRTWSDADGSGRITGRFTPDALAVISSALEPFQRQAFDAGRRAGVHERRECHAADAIVAMARAATSPATPETREGCSSDGAGPLSADPAGGHSARRRQAPGRTDTDSSGDDPEHPPVDPVGDSPNREPRHTRAPRGTDSSGEDLGLRRPAIPRPTCTDANNQGHSGAGDDPEGEGNGDGDGPSGPPGEDPGRHDDGRGRGPGRGGDDGVGSVGKVAAPPGPTGPAGASHALSGRRRPTGPRRPPATVIVRVDYAALVRGAREADETCEIDGVGTVAVATARALLTDSLLSLVIADGVDIRSVVHLGRRVTAHQHTALLARDVVCVVPGCHIRTGLEIDHVDEWSLSKVTRLDALARICHFHHYQKTYEGWTLNGPPGKWQWLPPPDLQPPADGRSDGPPCSVPGGARCSTEPGTNVDMSLFD